MKKNQDLAIAGISQKKAPGTKLVASSTRRTTRRVLKEKMKSPKSLKSENLDIYFTDSFTSFRTASALSVAQHFRTATPRFEPPTLISSYLLSTIFSSSRTSM